MQDRYETGSGMGRPPTPILSVDRIARAALSLVDRSGEFTMVQVADDLGVRPSSLYNHVDNKASIIEAMRSLVFQKVQTHPAASGESWQQTLRTLLRAYRDAFAEHPRLIPLLTAHTVSAPDVMRIYDEFAVELTAVGMPAERLLDVITVLDSFIIGSALDIAAPDHVWNADQTQNATLSAAIRIAATGRERADQSFELGLDLLLTGLEHSALTRLPPLSEALGDSPGRR